MQKLNWETFKSGKVSYRKKQRHPRDLITKAAIGKTGKQKKGKDRRQRERMGELPMADLAEID
jgi:hypothetical protein